MKCIAHLSDVHILNPRGGAATTSRYRLATKFVSLGRQMEPVIRSRRLARALAFAKEKGADHFVISGDLTEVGDTSEFEHLAEVLHAAKLPNDSVTLVPGNHDAYTSRDAWSRAMQGPLARFARASAADAGKVVDRGQVVLLPIDTSCFQTIARSSGEFTRQTAEIIDRRASDPGLRNKALVLVVHHPPYHPHRLLRWIDGLRGGSEVLELMSKHPRLQLLHGHLHRMMDRIMSRDGKSTNAKVVGAEGVATRFFGAAATCDDHEDAAPKVRFYRAEEGQQLAAS